MPKHKLQLERYPLAKPRLGGIPFVGGQDMARVADVQYLLELLGKMRNRLPRGDKHVSAERVRQARLGAQKAVAEEHNLADARVQAAWKRLTGAVGADEFDRLVLEWLTVSCQPGLRDRVLLRCAATGLRQVRTFFWIRESGDP